jgi:hypothetical protein
MGIEKNSDKNQTFVHNENIQQLRIGGNFLNVMKNAYKKSIAIIIVDGES